MIDDVYREKIKPVPELMRLLGPRPRQRKVIMCHGTFDIVHPGHIRHLLYAKSKADILVVSVTSDEHITKANFRPYLPDRMRAFNLAALEMVDYVVIDRQPKPLENLLLLQPDYFAKGYEYVDGKIDPRTREEMDVLESYGGEFIFTPGDIVYSSSTIIETQPPNLASEKLLLLLEGEKLTFGDLHRALDSLAGFKVHVIGDTIIDSYTYTTLIGGNAKTPTFSVRHEQRKDFVGGAGIVAKHLRAAGAEVTLTTVLGEDALKGFALSDLEQAGVRVNAVIDPTRPTTNKNAFIAGGYRLLKVDTLDNRAISGRVLHQFREYIAGTKCDAIVFSDFRHGIFNPETIPPLVQAIANGKYKVADSQVASRWGNILDFRDFDLLTPNEREARFALGDQDTVIRPLALRLYREARCQTLILKLGEKGLITYRTLPRDYDDVRAFFVVDSFADTVVDAVGAGDALLSYSTLTMGTAGNPVIASILGGMAAACECECDGNIPIGLDDVREKLRRFERRANYF
jgi:rfaE bifunctional protein kinase chain/domain